MIRLGRDAWPVVKMTQACNALVNFIGFPLLQGDDRTTQCVQFYAFSDGAKMTAVVGDKGGHVRSVSQETG